MVLTKNYKGLVSSVAERPTKLHDSKCFKSHIPICKGRRIVICKTSHVKTSTTGFLNLAGISRIRKHKRKQTGRARSFYVFWRDVKLWSISRQYKEIQNKRGVVLSQYRTARLTTGKPSLQWYVQMKAATQV